MALFKDTEDFCKAYPALASAEWEMLLPFVELVEAERMRDQVLGNALYAELHAAFQASIAESPTPLPAPMAALIKPVRTAVAFLAIAKAADVLNVTFDSSGMAMVENQNRKGAPMWRTKAAIAAIIATGYGWLNQTIIHLQANSGTLANWATSPVYAATRDSFIRDMRAVENYLPVSGPWLLHQLRPTMRRVQRGPVREIIGQVAYDAILTKLNNNSGLSTLEADILDHARPAMLHLALADQMVPLSLSMDTDGVWTWQAASSGSGISGGKVPAKSDKINGAVRSHQVTGDTHLELLRKLVTPDTNGIHYPSGTDGSLYFTGGG
jgi:hypothetical protein